MNMQSQDALACRQLGQMYKLKNDINKAVSYFERAVTLNPRDHQSHAMLLEIFSARGDIRRIVLHAMWALLGDPDNIQYKRNFIMLAGGKPFVSYSVPAEQAMLECFKTPSLDCHPAQTLWHSLFRLNPAHAKIYGEKAPDPDVSSPGLLPLLARPFFLQGLRRLVVVNKTFENFITKLRHGLLMSGTRSPEATALAASIACYACNNEYILDVTPAEEEAVARLRAEVLLQTVPEARDVALLACYARLSGVPDPKGGILQAAELLDLAESHIHEPRRLESIRQNIVSITPIQSGVSEKVRAQYEVFPYPRWRNLRDGDLSLRAKGILPKDPVNVLVAGCGTGKEVLSLASRMPGTKFLAVDLSTASLAYAIDKAGQLGVKNVTFRQGDILLLDVLKEKYDYIVCGGVLHHMEDPMAGWRVLNGLLEPGGVMSIALYSSAARPDIYAARAAIAKTGIADDDLGIRDFRRRCHALLPEGIATKLERRKDYYYMSMCRDLIFHVQEHGFSIPQIASCLEILGLDFLGFRLSSQAHQNFILKKIRIPEDRDLEAWNKFEAAHPDTFAGMYQFWCRKPKDP